MNDLFKELKDASDQAEYNKNYLIQKTNILKEELLQSNIKNTLTKNLLNQNYDENMKINSDEFDKKILVIMILIMILIKIMII